MPTTLQRPSLPSRERSPRALPQDDLRLRPAPTGRKVRLPELLLGVVLVGVGALAAVWLWSSTTTRTPVAVLRAPLAKGAIVTEADLRPAEVALGDGVRAVAWSDRARLVGRTAVADLPADTVLVSALVADQPVLAPGEALVGLKLTAGGYPAGNLRAGDPVAVVGAAPSAGPEPIAGAGTAITSAATVWDVTDVADEPGAVLVTLRLSEGDAQRVSAVADQVRVVRVVR